MSYKRADRVSDLIRAEIANMLLREELRDPRIGNVTLTKVKLSDDLKNAKIYFSRMGTLEEAKESEEGLNKASGFVRHMLGQRLGMRYVPKVRFYYDDSLAYSDKINVLSKEIHVTDERIAEETGAAKEEENSTEVMEDEK